MIIRDVTLVHTVFKAGDLIHDDRPQVIFVGRSNVGKSSLINSLLRRRNLARTSSTPGKTVSINYYLINGRFYFVDLPGYGYAKIPRSERKRVNDLMMRFFAGSRDPALVVQLIDARRGFMEADLEILEKILENRPNILTVMTKSDKISSSILATQTQKYQTLYDLHIVPFSVKSGSSREIVWEHIQRALEAAGCGSTSESS